MKIEQYKNDVSSLKLSDSFKQSLKESMAKEYAAVAVTQAPARPWMKYSKYIATAACLVLIVATIGVVSLMGDNLRVEKSADALQENNTMTLETYDSTDNGEIPAEEVTDDAYIEEDVELDVDGDVIVLEDDVADEEDDVAADDVEEEITEAVEPDMNETTEEAPADTYKSAYTPEDYDGEYITTDYVIGNDTSPEFNALNISESVELLVRYTSSSAYEEEGYDEMPVTSVTDEDEEPVAEEAAPADVLYKYNDSGISYSELSLDILRHMDSVNFVKLNISNVYDADEAYNLTGEEEFLHSRTLYEVNVTYDYLNGEDLDLTFNLAAYGTSENQLAGRPVFEEGESYASCLVFDSENYVEMLDELIYAVHRINGVDIAYHLVGGSGVNPGYTHMGMLDIEREVITTTLNNPAQYTHKAALKELYRYLRRNWAREEYPLTNFAEIGGLENSGDEVDGTVENDQPVVSGELVEELTLEFAQGEIVTTLEGVEFDPKGFGGEIGGKLMNKSNGTGSTSESSSLRFKGGSIAFDSPTTFAGRITEIIMTEGTTLNIKVNGVGVGDSLEALVDAFNIKHNVDGKLSLSVVTANANGTAFTVNIEVADNVITQMVIK
ncbi:MAG: hypothetical protein IJ424_01230 [Oscillospiraceae bacterium]|nr:hypothetical protein [Oscillospiraceae bacterium]